MLVIADVLFWWMVGVITVYVSNSVARRIRLSGKYRVLGNAAGIGLGSTTIVSAFYFRGIVTALVMAVPVALVLYGCSRLYAAGSQVVLESLYTRLGKPPRYRVKKRKSTR
jgi:hypothetical protein